MCSPLKALGGHDVDVMIVGGIGAGALMGLNQSGIKVHQASPGTVKNNVEAFKAGKLPELTAQYCCPGHGQSPGGCGH